MSLLESRERLKTNIYHITHTPDTDSVSLRFWGCNLACRGCLCKEGIYDHLLKEVHPDGETFGRKDRPQCFLNLTEITKHLDGIKPKQIFLTGEEAAIDPNYAAITKTFHERFRSENVLYTNGFKMPVITDTDSVEIGIKAFTEELHQWYTGRSAEPVKENFASYAKSGVKLTAASILIPGLVELPELERIARFISSVDETIPYFILPYFPAGKNPWRQTKPAEVNEAVLIIRKYLQSVSGCEGTEEEILHRVERVV